MITGLLGWFAGKPANKRQFPRKQKVYRASYVIDGTERPAIGLDISAGGLSFLAREKIAENEFDMLVQVERRVIRVRVEVRSEAQSTYQGARVYRYGMQYCGIAADDWDAVVRYTTGQPVAEPRNKAVEEIQRIQMTPDDMARLLPLSLQNRLLARLVRLGRLAPLDEKVTPLVQYFYEGIERRERGLVHRLAIQSKVVDPDDKVAFYETTFVFDDAGQNIQIVAGGPIERDAVKRA